ncbi:hemicentin-1-like [Saccostrea echinata]|uniref:hemicentin-1-like n=1 Tax=Saccostrea echinata TaxID=191078 RepID=UPI002A7F17DA|nr:hemicentin-1-like [Saccostrea echinata]
MDLVSPLLHLSILIVYWLNRTQAENEIENARQKRFWCNPWTGLYRTTCKYSKKIGEDTYRKCGWWNKRRCKSGTKYSWKITYNWCYRRCKVDGVWDSWSSWGGWGVCTGGYCSGIQKRYRSRSCTEPSPKNGGKQCRGSTGQSSTRSCKVLHSIVDGNWGSWTQWKLISPCSRTCDKGQQQWKRQRTCSNPAPRCGGKICQGSSYMNKYTKCFLKKCKVDGGWSTWRNWGDYKTCSKTCEGGKQFRQRVRYCTNPTPSKDGKVCKGKDKEKDYSICNVQHCPEDGKWSVWGSWGHFRHCSETCGHGVKYRYRYRECNNPEPNHGGKKCPGSLKDEDFKRCFVRKCPKLRVKGNKKENKRESSKEVTISNNSQESNYSSQKN